MINVGKTMPFLPPMTGNGNHTTYRNGDDWGIVRLWPCFTHHSPFDVVFIGKFWGPLELGMPY
jgi:hypothetical protein